MYLYLFIVTVVLTYVVCARVIKKKYNYWNSKNVKGPKPLPVFGNFKATTLQKENFQQYMRKIYEAYPEEKYVGLYLCFRPSLLLRDPELIKQVLIKDFNTFQDRGIKVIDGKLGQNLFETVGDTWKTLRHKMTPLFSSGKLKNMAHLIENASTFYVDYINNLVENNIEEEIKSLQSKLTLEIIGSCAFGLDLHSFSNEDNDFQRAAQALVSAGPAVRFWMALDILIPGIRKKLSFLTETSYFENFFINLVKSIIIQRGDEISTRKDFMDLMIELKQQGKVSLRNEKGSSDIDFDETLITAQAFIFYFAGFETSAATTSFLLYELAINLDIQDRLYGEVIEVCKKHDGNINYETISEMKYLEMVVDETLRKYPVVGNLLREASSDYTFTGTNLSIDKGTLILISSFGMHYDPEYFPNPDNFDPNRFSPENKQKLPHCVYTPFGDGPRNCIGMRFAKVASMMGVATFVKNFMVVPTKKTQRPLKFSRKSIPLLSEKGIWLKILKRDKQ